MRRNSSFAAAMALAAVAGLGMAASAMPAPRKGSSRDWTDDDVERAFARNAPPKPGPDAAMREEIAAHNAAVDMRKAEKRARKLAR
jgi:hypothetical protein